MDTGARKFLSLAMFWLNSASSIIAEIGIFRSSSLLSIGVNESRIFFSTRSAFSGLPFALRTLR